MIKVLYTINGLRVNGMSAVIMQYITNLSKTDYSFSIFTDEIDPQYKPILQKYNVNTIQSRMRRKNQLAYYKELLQVIREGQFDIVHAHGNSATIAVEMLAAKHCHVPMRIAHSHNTTCNHKYIDKILRPILYSTYTHGIGCGIEAGKWLFGNKQHVVIKNGIDLQKFAFNAEERERVRKECNIEGKYVLGHIGRFTNQKNHEFLLRIFEQYASDDSVLLLVGNGPLENQIKESASKLDIADKVIFYGTTSNTASLYSAMDCFIFPSKFEGVPLTLVEAQANGLPCIISDRVSPEVIQTDLVTVHELDTPLDWARSIPSIVERSSKTSLEAIQRLEKSGFGIQGVIEQLDAIYKSIEY